MNKFTCSTSVGIATILLLLGESVAAPAGTAFTYQGQLKQNGLPLNGTCDMIFSLWNDPDSIVPANRVGTELYFDTDPATTNPVGGDTTAPNPIEVSKGLFDVALDFGAASLNGNALWLQVEVRCPTGLVEAYTILTPRQPITATPYAVHTRGLTVDTAENVGVKTDTPTEALHVAGNLRVDGWIGTDASAGPDQPVDFFVNGNRGLRIEHAENRNGAPFPNVIGGASSNTAGVTAWGVTVGGGEGNTASGAQATISGGGNNTVDGVYATIGGGNFNTASGSRSTVCGGSANTATGGWSTIPGGMSNSAGGGYSLAAGQRASVRVGDSGTFVWSDSTTTSPNFFTSTGPNQFLINATGGVGIGTNRPSEQLDVSGNIHASGTIASGNSITIDGTTDTITASTGTISFDDANLVTTGTVTGGAFVGDGSGLTGLASNHGTVPIGTVVDYYLDPDFNPLPQGWEVCDGTEITDLESPIVGMLKPDFSTPRYVRGTAIANQLPDVGGASYVRLVYSSGSDGPSVANTASAIADVAAVEGNTESVPLSARSGGGGNTGGTGATASSANAMHRHVWLQNGSLERGQPTFTHDWLGDQIPASIIVDALPASGGLLVHGVSAAAVRQFLYTHTDNAPHSHSVTSHTHDISNHVHPIPSHAHGVNTHDHTGAPHSHGMGHTHDTSHDVTIDLPDPPFVGMLKIIRVK